MQQVDFLERDGAAGRIVTRTAARPITVVGSAAGRAGEVITA
jgi:hypothetical protein